MDPVSGEGVDTAAIEVDVSSTARPNKRQQLAEEISRIDRYLLRADGTMWMTDQACDITMRFLYPIAYLITIGVLFEEVWGGLSVTTVAVS
jgi:tetrahydromethanopterin S-methyltransferase subunit E